MTEQNAELLQVLIRQIGQDCEVDRVLAESRLLLTEAKTPQPIPDFHDGALRSAQLIIIQVPCSESRPAICCGTPIRRLCAVTVAAQSHR